MLSAQNSPKIQVEPLLLKAEQLMDRNNPKAAKDEMDKIIALQKEHDLTLPVEFHFKYAQLAFNTESFQAALNSVNRYLAEVGREGEFYKEALKLQMMNELREPLKNYFKNLAHREQRTRQGGKLELAVGLRDLNLDNQKAVVNGKSLISFGKGVSKEQKEDVLTSTALALRKADEEYPNSSPRKAWYAEFSKSLLNIFWVPGKRDFFEFSTKEREFHMDQEALKVVELIATKSGITLLSEALKTLESEENSNQLNLFESHSSFGSYGNFQLSVAELDENRDLVLHMGGFYFEAKKVKRRFLFFKWRSTDIKFWAEYQPMFFNETSYSRDRDFYKKLEIKTNRGHFASLQ